MSLLFLFVRHRRTRATQLEFRKKEMFAITVNKLKMVLIYSIFLCCVHSYNLNLLDLINGFSFIFYFHTERKFSHAIIIPQTILSFGLPNSDWKSISWESQTPGAIQIKISVFSKSIFKPTANRALCQSKRTWKTWLWARYQIIGQSHRYRSLKITISMFVHAYFVVVSLHWKLIKIYFDSIKSIVTISDAQKILCQFTEHTIKTQTPIYGEKRISLDGERHAIYVYQKVKAFRNTL